MSAPVDPLFPVQQLGQTNADYAATVKDYMYRTGGGGAGSEHARMAAQWLGLMVTVPAPTAWTIL